MKNPLTTPFLAFLVLAYSSPVLCNVIKLESDQALVISTTPEPAVSSAESWESEDKDSSKEAGVTSAAVSLDEPSLEPVAAVPEPEKVPDNCC